jgi:AcrR family transcriptional regulator
MRRTKEEARATCHRLLDAAERVFLAQGVAGTSLNDIAMEAGTTRGAIYWHFRDKADLFNAMMDRVTLPLQAAASRLVESPEGEDALPSLRSAIRAALSLTVRDTRAPSAHARGVGARHPPGVAHQRRVARTAPANGCGRRGTRLAGTR